MADVNEAMADSYDVVIVGGGAAGLSGALALARSRRSVLVLDAGSPRNAPASGVHGYLSREGVSPAAFLELGRAEVRAYGGHVVSGLAEAVSRDGDSFAVSLAGGGQVRARRLLVATGLVDELPEVPGLAERWGRDVLQCPYCHGWEFSDKTMGVLASGPLAVHQALMFRQWTPEVTLFTHTEPRPDRTEAEQLAARGIRIVAGEVEALEVAEDRLTGVRLRDGGVVAIEALAIGPRFVARSDILAPLGLKPTSDPLGAGEFIASDPTGLTDVPGVWVAGNVTDLTAQVLSAAASGATAGTAINADLIDEETEAAVVARDLNGGSRGE